MKRLHGLAASGGIADAPAYVFEDAEPVLPDLDDPLDAFREATSTAATQLIEIAERAEASGRSDSGEILRAQAMMAEDPMLAEKVGTAVEEGTDLGTALADAEGSVREALENSGVPYLAERAADVSEIVTRIRHALAGTRPPSLGDLSEPSIVVAHDLAASDAALLDPKMTVGFITESGGPTGHVSVIARSLGIPAIVGLKGAVAAVAGGARVVLDGSVGDVVVDPDGDAVSDFAARAEAWADAARADEVWKGRSVRVGVSAIEIAANVGERRDIEAAVDVEADGIGLFRTEFLFLDTDQPPSEEEQLDVYRLAATSFEHPVVIRTFDIGGDKPARFLSLPEEENPFLGVRGVRLYDEHREIAVTQARAILRAARHGPVWAMVPMVATVADVELVRSIFDGARAELEANRIGFGEPRIGIMIEVPAAALNARVLASRVDFFSIGTNDLTQYTMAADRGSSTLSGYGDAADPAVLRLCAMTAAAGREHGVVTSVCGESASDPLLSVLYAAMGIDKLSVGAKAVNRVKRRLGELDPSGLEKLLERTLDASSAAEVRAAVVDHAGSG